MASKRGATSDLNHDNWDQDDDPEDSGIFKRASEDALKKRVIKTAKRRNPISSVRESENKNVFSAFTFQNSGSSSVSEKPASSSFGFLNNVQKKDDTSLKPNGTNCDQEKKLSADESKGNLPEYYAKIKGLNESVARWIKAKVDENPIISLVPIFRDYERYMSEIEKFKVSKDLAKIDTTPMASFQFKSASSMPVPDSTSEKSNIESKKEAEVNAGEKKTPQFSFGIPSSGSPTKPPPATSSTTSATFSFGGSTSTTTKPMFSFGTSTANASTNSSATTPTFSFGSSTNTPFGNSTASPFGNTATTPFGSASSTPFGNSTFAKPAPVDQKPDAGEEDDEDAPPKVEITPVIEKDHIYTIRCKVFIKKGDSFGNGSVGNLFLKQIEGSQKVQLVVRADTNLGNLLCNFILAESIPIKRLGKKDVMLVCVPTPEAKPPPVPMLLRVKSGDEADELLKTLEKYKK